MIKDKCKEHSSQMHNEIVENQSKEKVDSSSRKVVWVVLEVFRGGLHIITDVLKSGRDRLKGHRGVI